MECSESVKEVSFVLHHTHIYNDSKAIGDDIRKLTDVTPGTEAATTKAAKAKN